MTDADRERWNQRYREDSRRGEHRPFPLLKTYAQPGAGASLALDLACGPGHNALWLAQRGYRVVAVDISRVALHSGVQRAQQLGVLGSVLFVEADLDDFAIPAGRFDLVCVFRFLERRLFPALERALKPDGLLLYATLNWRWAEQHPEVSRRYLLEPGELGSAFGTLETVHHTEPDWMSFYAGRRPRA